MHWVRNRWGTGSTGDSSPMGLKDKAVPFADKNHGSGWGTEES